MAEEEKLDRGDDLLDLEPEEELKAAPEKEPEGAPKEAGAKEDVKEDIAAAKEPEPDEGIMLPKSRFDAKNAQLRAAQARISELEAAVEDRPVADIQPDIPTTFDEQIAALDKQYAQAVADGEAEKAAGLMRDARILERQRADELIVQATQGVAARTSEDVRYDRVVETLEDNYPFLNPDEETYNEEVSGDIRDLTEAYVASGNYSSPDALVIATDLILAREGLSGQPAAKEARTTNTAKNTDAAGKQPPDTAGLGKASDTAGPTSANPDPAKLSQKEFDALPAEVISRMRGDVM